MTNQSSSTPERRDEIPKKKSVSKRRRVFRHAVRIVLFVLLLYPAINLIGLIPVNNDFKSTPNGVEIFVISSAVHADLVMPISHEAIDWREQFPSECFVGNTDRATHVAIGWGDKGFYLETPTWADLKLSTAARALLWPSDSCMHVILTDKDYLGEDARSILMSTAEYERLVDFIQSSFRVDDKGENIQIEGFAYSNNDAFFEAIGTYHCVNTCNTWAGRAMRSAGIRTPWLTHLPKMVFLYLPEKSESAESKPDA